MTLRLNGNTSGYTEIDAPAVAGSNTLTLPTGAGSTYQMIRNGATAGSLEFADNITSGTAVASTSGTSIDFTSIPSWVKRITVMFDGVSLNGVSHLLVQIGDSGGIETTSYKAQSTISNSGSTTLNSVAGFPIFASEAAFNQNGNLIINTLGNNTWTATGTNAMIGGSSNSMNMTGGSKTLSGTLDRVRITTINGTDTFDAGSINILYE